MISGPPGSTNRKALIMKKILVFAVMMLCGSALFADASGQVQQVKVSVTAERNSFSVKKELASKAKQAAIVKYIRMLNAKTPDKLIEEACNEYDNFVDDVEKLSEKWLPLDRNHGQLTGEFRVTLKNDAINDWLKTKGFNQQGGIELIIMEEPPTQGQMKLDKAFGNGIDGMKFFLQNYTTFQRRIRDAVVKKVGTFGFDVKLLEDNDQYEKFKNKDGNLVGVFFDVNKNTFSNDPDLMKAVKENNPDTLVLYYRIDALIFENTTRNIRSTVAFNIKNLRTGIQKSIGASSFQFTSTSANKDGVIDDLAYCAEAAMNSLMNAEGAASKLNQTAMSIRNKADMPKGPLKLIVNASAFDKKLRKRVMYMLKKEIIAKKITSESNFEPDTNTTLTATIDNPNIKTPDVLYMEYISPILEKNGIELSDEYVVYDGNTLTIKQP